MLKKLLILPLIGGLMSFGAFASATDITITASDNDFGYSPNSLIITNSAVINSVSYNKNNNSDNTFVVCSSNDNDGKCGYETAICQVDSYGDGINTCSNVSLTADTYYFYNSGNDPIDSLVLSYTVSSSDSSDSSTIFPSIPSSFTSGITALVSNFGSTLVGWLPTIILVALGIYAIFALFRVVRNYARSTFNG